MRIAVGVVLIVAGLAGGAVSAFEAFITCSGWYASTDSCRQGEIGLVLAATAVIGGVVLVVRGIRGARKEDRSS